MKLTNVILINKFTLFGMEAGGCRGFVLMMKDEGL